ncbi:hypothetical protein PFISCL1PPCAC_12424, partial [Pristionchus fissidentatus]
SGMTEESLRKSSSATVLSDYSLFDSARDPHAVRKASHSSCVFEKGLGAQDTRVIDYSDTTASLMADHNGTGDSRDSPLQRSGSRAPGSGAASTRASSAAIGRLDSGASSPLLQTEMLPEEDGCVCPYCHRDYRKPRVLDCLHSMCEDCIIAQLDGRRDAAKARELEKRMATDCVLQDVARNDRPTPPGVIKCPTCSQESHVGNDIRFVHSMLVDYVRAAVSGDLPVERNCRACKSEQAAVAYCRQCGADLCPNCLQAHKEMRMFDGHETLSYDELEASGRAGDARRVLCSSHGQPYIVLCATCEALACRNCLDGEHMSHKMVDVTPVVVRAISNELVETMENVATKWSNALESWHSEADRASTLMTQFETAKATIDAAYEEAARILEASKQKKMHELEEARDRQEELIEDVYKKVDITQTRIDGATKFTNRLLDSANGVELLASRKKVLHQLRSLEHTMPSLHSECELRFAPVMKKTLEAALRNAVGDIISQAVPSSVSSSIGVSDGIGSTTTRISAAESEWSGGAANGVKERGEERGGGGQERVVAALPPTTTTVSSSTTLSSTITPIGGERAARKAQGGVGGGGGHLTPIGGGFAGGWPPSSNPPELPSPSPPKELAAAREAAASVVPTTVSAAAAALQLVQQQQQPSPAATAALPPPWAALAANQAAADPRLAALLQAANFPGGAGANSVAAAAAAKQLQMAMFLQQQQQQHGNLATLRQFGAVQAAADAHILRQMVAANAAAAAAAGSADQGILAAGLGKNVHEIKLAFAHGTGTAGNSLRELHSPGGFAVAENDEILIADTNNHRIVVITPTMPWKFGRPGQEDGQLCFPRRVVAMRGYETPRYVVIDKAVDNKSRAQLFGATGEFIRRINLTAVVPKGGIEVWAATSTPTGHLVMVDQSSVIYTLDIKEAQPRVVNWVDASNHLMEASDVAVHEKCIYVTDFRGHGVHVFSHEGTYLRKIGEPSHTPFPIGIDVARSGELLIAHTHGNKLTIVCYSPEGTLQHQFVNCDFRVRVEQMSRCAALRCTSTGHVVTLSKHAHTLYGFRRILAPRT